MYDGFLSFGGTELINEERTRKYIEHQLPQMAFRKNPDPSETLHVALGHTPYESPLVDDAEWANPSDPASLDFFGLYPLGITGIGDSTQEASSAESIGSGGHVNQARDATRLIRVHGLLLAANELGVESGLSWLRAALRADNCSSHGGGCGSADLRYFLDNPDVCFEKFQMVDGRPVEGENYSVGALSPDTSPIIVNINQAIEAPAYVTWQFQLVDGVVITWGRMARKTSRVMQESAPTILQRTNFVRNPSFASNTQGYLPTTGSISWVATDGADGTGYGAVTGVGPDTSRVNYAPDPDFTLATPQQSGWRTIGDTTMTSAGGVATIERGTGLELSAEVSLLGPYVTPVPAAISIWMSERTAPVTLTLLDNLSHVQIEEEIPAGAAGRVSLVTPVGTNYVLRLAVEQDELQVKQILVEEGTVVGTPFSGSTPSVVGVVYYRYFGATSSTPGAATSPSIATPPSSINVLQMDAPDTRYGDVTVSFAARSYKLASVLAQIVSLDDDTILSTKEIQLDPGWKRYSLATHYGRNIRVVLRGSSSYDLDQVLIEASPVPWDYFDGSTNQLADYQTSWLGLPNNSYSRRSWLGSTLIQQDNSDWRPFIVARQGTLPDVRVDIGHYDQIAVSTQLDPYERNYHDVATVRAPAIISRPNLSIGAAIEVEFFLVAETPFAFSNGREIDVSALSTALFTDPEVVPGDPASELVDPDCGPIPVAPRPPAIPELCVDDLTEWRRYYLDLPAEHIALWAATVPTISLTSKAEEVRQVRIRFHPNPFGYEKETVDPLSYCGEFILSYLPAQTVLTVNGMNERAFAAVSGAPFVPADHLLYGTGGTPMEWPELTCGISYVMTIDVPETDDLDNLELELTVNRRE